MKRREFLLKGSLLSLTGLSLLQCKTQKMTGALRDNIGLQLYTVRDAMTADPIATLKAIAGMGYQQVENAGYAEGKYYNMGLKEFKTLLNDLGLTMISGHTLTGAHKADQKRTMINQWEAACEDAATIGQKTIVCAYLFDFERKTLDDYKKLMDLLNKCGETAKKYGINLAYHNHDFEFMEMEGVIPYDLMLNQSTKDVLNFELDLYWIKYAGKDALSYFKNHSGRFPLWHVKDMDAGKDRIFTEVGNGTIDWKTLFAAKELAGMKQFYVEQDTCKNHAPLDSIKISIDYLKKNIV